MAELTEVQSVIDRGGHRAVVSAVRADGSVQSSLVAAGLTEHPVTGEPAAAFTTAADAVKLRLLRERPQASLVFQAGYHWASVAGHADLIGYDDPYDGVDSAHLRALLRGVFAAAGGTHDDWAEYDRAMEEQRRTAVLIRPDRVFAM
ncbi:pyridoxamine 5'-phosphate oxidase family protein [Nocardiopsis chromatogenes]|uniref:pyridoxamine 5'-phosphate oxidase family protein n=1 Tax=Nocardiopsis chromatogenes TaxID=280239 RepID=UPI000348F6E8|nr:pyridoxamine 5'-phosphate oxidase family protein [Nocardiopsis chromatogenes]